MYNVIREFRREIHIASQRRGVAFFRLRDVDLAGMTPILLEFQLPFVGRGSTQHGTTITSDGAKYRNQWEKGGQANHRKTVEFRVCSRID
jgi:hypothetical protein